VSTAGGAKNTVAFLFPRTIWVVDMRGGVGTDAGTMCWVCVVVSLEYPTRLDTLLLGT
jgi:hypothetical protein